MGEVVKAVVETLRDNGCSPVLVPAMGSHGGATPAGQLHVLHELGIDERALGIPADASMEAVEVGRLRGGQAVYVSRAALACDAVVPVNRVKPHTDFRAPVESGLTKMLTIGLGKEVGADSLHRAGFQAFDRALPEAARLVLAHLRVPFGVALVEDEWHRLRGGEVVPGELVQERDRALLEEAWEHFGRLPFSTVDCLVLREIGKTISGAGMDPNVTGRFAGVALPAKTTVERLVVLDLASASSGNAIGVGQADIVTERLRSKVDWPVTYANAAASKSLAGAKLPFVAGSDLVAIALALVSRPGGTDELPGMVAMANTLEVDHIAVSAPLLTAAETAGYVRTNGPCRGDFDGAGNLVCIGGLSFFPASAPKHLS